MAELEEEKRALLRRTLAVISGLYAGEHLLLSPLLFRPGMAGGGLLAPRTILWIMVAHMATLVAAAIGVPRPRPWGWPAAFLAGSGSAFLAVLMFLKDSPWNGAMYAVYPVLAAALFLRGRNPA